jgi:BTB/POZ domain
VIRIIVGPEREVFNVHKCVLLRETKYQDKESTFFEGCFKHGFKETQQNEITLEDVMPEAFLLVVRWLYSDNIWIVNEPDQFEKQQPHILYQAYILSDRLGIESLQNTIMDGLHRLQTVQQCIVDLKDEALSGDDLPKLLEDYVFDLLVFQLEYSGEEVDIKTLEDVIEAGGERAVRLCRRIRMGPDAISPECAADCRYHLHDRTRRADCRWWGR